MDENLVRQTHRATYPKENTQNTMRIAMYLIMTEEKKINLCTRTTLKVQQNRNPSFDNQYNIIFLLGRKTRIT
jgi:sulfur relay (sulfurtransferase) complex TusBCD TusD component (DsrE family)